MATKNKVNKKSNNPLLENPDAIAEKLSSSEQWIEDNKTLVFSVVGGIVLIIGGFLFYNNYQSDQNVAAQSDMYQAQYWFEADSLDLALNGDGNDYGFLDIIDNYGSTKAGNLARFYAGVSLLKQGDYAGAVDYLEEFNAGDKIVQARAYALIGDAYMEQGQIEDAVSQYEKAANYNPNDYFTPTYLLKQALAYEQLSDYSKAIGAYDQIINDFPNSDQIANARKHKARLEAKASE